MTYARPSLANDLTTLPRLPAWVTAGRPETLENVAFRSGSALTVLDALVSDPAHGVPVKLLANRLALKAATATSNLEGRLAREADIRDAYHLTLPGEARGPDGDLLAFWREGARLRLSGKGWVAQAVSVTGERFEDVADDWLTKAKERAWSQGPLTACTGIMANVLVADDRAERVACLLADVVLAKALRWDQPLPLTALYLTKANLRALIGGAGEGELAIHRAICRAAQTAIQLAHDLARRTAALKAITRKLRAKGSDAAVDLFLTEDAVAPSTMLSPTIRGTNILMTDRAARRFCDRLVELGVARELTGRPTFRLYGL